MRKLIPILMLVLAATTAIGVPSVIRKSGDCKLAVGDMFEDKKVFTVELANPDVQLTCKFRGGDFFGEFTVFANPSISNKCGKKLMVSYNVAFFDKAGELIACAEQSGDVDAAAKNHQFGSCMSKLSQEEFAKIAAYKVVVYVSEPVKKK